ncbi:hypothetical protein LGH70_22680 [Hymenobacter sp. BT635]|uniref:Uncharacterized protein n=1 Tax=Hymenobacter nitidus TaxID=2880929 RepID=A0ABS8AJH4_9BACT|nr:hypothetical protein [Hymenobacter nitidus]MCB2380416.1 hypothetical protein [Hymenobacter nitidus]
METGFTITTNEVKHGDNLPLTSWQVVLKITNNHGVGVGGKVYARVGLTKVIDKLVGILPGQTTAFDFRDPEGPFTRIWTDDLICTHADAEHVFSFAIERPVNATTYSATID